MARERSSRRGAEEAVPEAAPTGARGRSERGGGKSAGGSSSGNFAVSIAFAAGLAAAVLAFAGAMMLGGKAAPDATGVLDKGGVQAARMLAAAGAERWKPGRRSVHV